MIVNYASPRIDGTTGTITVLIHVGNATKKDSSGLREVPAADEVLTPAHRAALLKWLGIDPADQAPHQCPRSMTDIMRESAGETNR